MRIRIALVAAVALFAGCAAPDAPRSERQAADYLRLLAAEDARPTQGRDLQTLVDATRSQDPYLRAVAVRALGRLENPALAEDIAPLLADVSVPVRAEAANALAQAVHGSDGDAVIAGLIERARVERDSLVLAALARSIGRSASSPATRARAADALVQISGGAGGDAPVATQTGVALGFESLVRGARGQGLGAAAAARLGELSVFGVEGGLLGGGEPVRRLAYSSLGQARRLDRGLIERIMRDPSPNVRAVAGAYLEGIPPGGRPELIRRLLGDPDLRVAIGALQAIAREPRTELYCRFLLAAAQPTVRPPLRVVAVDALSRGCPQAAAQRTALVGIVGEISSAPDDGWQPAAHALVSLAAQSREDVGELLPLFAANGNPFVRAYAARAAGLVDDRRTLRGLAADPDPNVRTAAVQALFGLDGHEADGQLVDQLGSDDPQLLLTVAGLLEGSPSGSEAAPALLTAFERISAAGRETWRDARRALLARVSELGEASLAPRLEPYLADYDPVVANDVAALLRGWQGRARSAAPVPAGRLPLPTPAEYRSLRDSRITLHMAGGPVVIELRPELATTNVYRFVRLAEAGYFDGLTFHRWAPNFVLQGGSPHANEYQGDGPYTRDEVGLPAHWRGTVGISTRGRDTGDGQIFVNLVDNVRLDHDYTIVGRVVDGMDVVDAALEGAVIERAEVRRGG